MSKLQYADIDADNLVCPGKGKWSPVWAINLRGESSLAHSTTFGYYSRFLRQMNFYQEEFIWGYDFRDFSTWSSFPLTYYWACGDTQHWERVHGIKVTHNWRIVRKRTKVRSQHFHQRCSSIDPTSSREPLPPVVSLLATRPLTHKTLKRKLFRSELSIYMCQQQTPKNTRWFSSV